MWTRRNLTPFSNRELLDDMRAARALGRDSEAITLEDLIELDDRKFYLPAGYQSLYAYCVGELEMTEPTALKRIHALRAARKCPRILEAIADGRLHLATVYLLASKLTRENGDELLSAAAHKTCAQVKQLLAERFPKPDVPTSIRPQVVAIPEGEHESIHTCVTNAEHSGRDGGLFADASRTVIAPLAPGRDELHGTMSQKMSANLRYAQSLSGHSADSRDPMAVLDRALECYVARLEQRRFGAASRTRPRKSHANGRYVPAEIRREVWERDGGRCTFVGDTGHRCEAHDRLEFDHIVTRARGGATSTENLRLRCRAHNQYEAERTFGAGFMQEKREAAKAGAAEEKKRRAAEKEENERAAAAAAQAREAERAAAAAAAKEAKEAKVQAAAEASRNDDVIPYLRALRVPLDRARAAAAHCDAVAGEPLERRVRFALSTLPVRGVTKISFAPASGG